MKSYSMNIHLCIYIYIHIYICACVTIFAPKTPNLTEFKVSKSPPSKKRFEKQTMTSKKTSFCNQTLSPKKGEINQTMTFSRFTFSKKIGNTLHHYEDGFHHLQWVFSYILDGFFTGFEMPSHQALKDVSRPQVTHLGPLGGTTKDRGFRRSKARRKFCSKSTIMDWAMERWMDGWMDGCLWVLVVVKK